MRPLNSPYHPDSNPKPDPHLCMKSKKPGVFLDKYDNKKKEEDDWNKRKGYTGPPPPAGVHLGVTHLWLEDKKEFTPLYKCPLCSFQNIHKEVINHHIRLAFDTRHNQSGIRI